jgi:RND family efflux transporter MFP subunit
MMKTKIYTTLLHGGACLLLAFMTSCGQPEAGTSIPKDSDRVPVKVMTLSPIASTGVIMASGQLTTDDETVLGFKIGGVVGAVLVQAGDAVKKGQLLARLDPTEIDALLAQARQGYEKTKRDFERTSALYKDSVATLEQLQNIETALAVAREQLEAASFNRAYAEIHAPAHGYVLHKFVNAGQVVAPGAPILVTNGAAQAKWILKTGVSDKQWAMIKAGDPAEVTIDAFTDQSFQGKVIRKSERSDPQTGAFTVELQVESRDTQLAAGLFASARIKSGRTTTSWSVPYESVLDAHGNSGFVFITNDRKTAIRQPVILASFNGNTIHISQGLEHAQTLIVSGSAYLTDGSLLEIIP